MERKKVAKLVFLGVLGVFVFLIVITFVWGDIERRSPSDYPDTRWSCGDPQLTIFVDESRNLRCRLDGKPLPKNLKLIVGQPGQHFLIEDVHTNETVFEGSFLCLHSKMYVTVEKDDLFQRYVGKKLKFVRSDGYAAEGFLN